MGFEIPEATAFHGGQILSGFVQNIRHFLRGLETLPYRFARPYPAERDLAIVTGASSNHFRSLLQFLESARRHEPGTLLIAWDLGLEACERQELSSRFPDVQLRTFDYSKHPAWFDIRVRAGEYAWKPTIVADMMDELQRPMMWLDAGCVITEPLIEIRRILRGRGFYTPRSPGTIRDWTHPACLSWLNASSDLLGRGNICGGTVGVDPDHPAARSLIQRWRACAQHKECIAPEGSTSENHRQDQAILSVLAHQSGLARTMPKARYGFLVQQDCDPG